MKITTIIAPAAISLGIAGTSSADDLKFTVVNGHCLYRRAQDTSSVAVYPNHIAGSRQESASRRNISSHPAPSLAH